MTQPGGKAHRGLSSKKLSRHRAAEAHKAKQNHHQAHFDHIAPVIVSDACIHNGRHHQRNQQLKAGFQQLEQWAKHALFAVSSHVFQKFAHLHFSLLSGQFPTPVENTVLFRGLYHCFQSSAIHIQDTEAESYPGYLKNS